MKISKDYKLSDILFAFDGVGGFHHNYGVASDGRDVAVIGYGRTYGEALDQAMEYLAESPHYDVDLGYFSDPTTQIEKAFDRAAAEAGIDPESTAEVDAAEFDLRREFDGTDEEFEDWVCMEAPSEVGLVIWFDLKEVESAE